MSRALALTLALTLAGAAFAADNGLLFHAAFDGSTSAYSLAGAGEPVQVVGPAAAFAPGKQGQALICGAEQTLLHYRTAGNLFPRAGTISFWVKPENWSPTDGNFHSFFESGNGGEPNGWLVFYKYYQNGWLLLRYADEREKVGMATHPCGDWKPGAWHHLAATWAPEALRIYVDGQLQATAPAPLVADTLGDTFRLGDNGWHLPHVGARTLLDEVRIYGYPLSAAQVRDLAGVGTLAVTRDPGGDKWQVRYKAPNSATAASARLTVTAYDGAEVLPAQAQPLTAGSATFDLDVSNLAPGKYRLQAAAQDAAGATVAETALESTRRPQERLVLANSQVRLTFDGGTGGLLAISRADGSGAARAPLTPAPIFNLERVNLADHARFYKPEDVEKLAASETSLQQIGVRREGKTQTLVAEYSFAPGIRAVLKVSLPDDSPVAAMTLQVTNPRPVRPSEAWRLPAVTFPALDGLKMGESAEDDTLATGRVQGETLSNPAKSLPGQRTLQYPGSACVPWQSLYDPSGGLYLGPQADGNVQLEIQAGTRDGLVELGNRWWLLSEPGETWTSPVVELALHPAPWYWPADHFRAWALKRTPPRQQPPWLATCDGWTGYGYAGYKFKDLPQVFETAKYYGFTYLQLWGQMVLGNAYYCYFSPNPQLGTEADLRAALAKIRAQGGHVGFYSNAITFDGGIDGNKLLREELAKTPLSKVPPLPRFYDDAINSIFVGPDGRYGHSGAAGHSEYGYLDGYWGMDPGARWWQDYLTAWITKWHKDYGAEVWYLDSFPVQGYGLGPAAYTLQHCRPQSLGAGQLGLLKRIRTSFPGPILYEGVACAAFMPWTNWCLGTEFSFGSWPGSRPEIFVRSFGDVYPVFSGTCNTWKGIASIFPDLKDATQRHTMNYVFVLGERFDTLGLHPVDKKSAYAEHVKALVALRRQVRDVVYAGRMRDVEGLRGMPEQVVARVFVRAQAPAVVVTAWDRREQRAPWTLQLDLAALGLRGTPAKCQVLKLDGSKTALTPTSRDGKLELGIPGEEVLAVRVEGLK